MAKQKRLQSDLKIHSHENCVFKIVMVAFFLIVGDLEKQNQAKIAFQSIALIKLLSIRSRPKNTI